MKFDPKADPIDHVSPYKRIETGGGKVRPHIIAHRDVMAGNMDAPDRQFYDFVFEDYGEANWVLKKKYR